MTEEGRKEKELFDQANQAACGWAEADVPLQQANEKAYTIKRFDARRFKNMWRVYDEDGNDISIGYRGDGGASGAGGNFGAAN